jgi:hypothetical protein
MTSETTSIPYTLNFLEAVIRTQWTYLYYLAFPSSVYQSLLLLTITLLNEVDDYKETK